MNEYVSPYSADSERTKYSLVGGLEQQTAAKIRTQSDNRPFMALSGLLLLGTMSLVLVVTSLIATAATLALLRLVETCYTVITDS